MFKKKKFCLLLTVFVLLSLCACGNSGDPEATSPQEQVQTETATQGQTPKPEQIGSDRPMTEGWLMTELEMPAKMGAVASSGADSDQDWFWMAGRSKVEGIWCITLLGYDTAGSVWRQFNLTQNDLGIGQEFDLDWAIVNSLSVKDGIAWLRIECSTVDRSQKTAKLVTVNTATGQAGSTDWSPEKALRSPDEYIAAFAALSGEQALIVTPVELCTIDRNFDRISDKSVEAGQVTGTCKVGEKIFLTDYDGIAQLDMTGFSLGSVIPIQLNESNDFFIVADSVPGNILYSGGKKLYSLDSSGGTELVLDWMDVATDREAAEPLELFENSKGELYSLVGGSGGLRLMKTVKTQIPVKGTLTMACFFDNQSVNAQTRMTGDMADAVMAFNNSDADHKIKPVYFEYAGSQDLSRALIEAFNSDIDLVDQSNLPEGSMSGSQLMDLLPYLDTDPDISREDFFQSALQGMIWGGHMYRVSPYYSAMGMNVPTSIYPGQEEWSSQWIQQAIAADPSLAMGKSKIYTREYVVKTIAYAMTGEFIDLGSMSCDFKSPEFSAWLGMMTSMIDNTGFAEDGISFTCGVDSYYLMRGFDIINGFGADNPQKIVGFPDSKGSGIYLASPAAVVAIQGEYNGLNTSVSIASGCEDPQAAWSFIKQLLSDANGGIPVLKSVFDRVMDYNTRTYSMLPEDIETLRWLAEDAAGVVIADPALIQLISGELNAYASGDKSAEDAAAQLQSRVSIYLAEQG